MIRFRLWRPVAVVLLAGGCGRGEGSPQDAPAVVGARTAPAQAQAFTEAIDAIGTVEPQPGRVASLAAPAPARDAAVLVRVGQTVADSSPLVRLEQPPFQAAEQSAAATLAAAERAHERAQRLADAGIAARRDVEQAAADLARARADLVTARRELELATLRAPFAGVVTGLWAVLGAAADPSQPLVEVADPSALDLVFTVTAAQTARIRLGAHVSVRARPQGAGDTLAEGTVVEVAGQVDSLSRGVAVRARVGRGSRALRIGETVFGDIVVAVRPDAVTIPVEALVPNGEGFKVFVVDSAGTAHERSVTVGGQSGDLAEIRDGLAAGERVVTYGAYGVDDGARIAPADTVQP